jgi:hypothetical protein
LSIGEQKIRSWAAAFKAIAPPDNDPTIHPDRAGSLHMVILSFFNREGDQ